MESTARDTGKVTFLKSKTTSVGHVQIIYPELHNFEQNTFANHVIRGETSR